MKTLIKLLAVFCLLASAISAFAQANLAVYQPTSPSVPTTWSAPLVITTVNGGVINITNNLTTTNALYVDWALVNNGNQSASDFDITVYIDGAAQITYTFNNTLPPGSFIPLTGDSIGTLSAGTHTISFTGDSGHVLTGAIETNNSYTNTIVVTVPSAPAPTLTAPLTGSTGQSTTPTFTWTAVSGVPGYRIIVATNAADLPTSPGTGYGGASVYLDATTNATSFTPTVPFVPGTTYYWEVHAWNAGDYGTWSSISNFTTGTPPSGLTIVPTFDSTITSDPNATTIENTIKAAIAVYQANFSDSITANITFMEESSGLGNSSFSVQSYGYSSYLAALTSHATTPDDTTALAHLPSGSLNPVNGNGSLYLQFPLARALGLSSSGGSDGTVFLNVSIMNLSQATNDPNKYALFSVVSHEIDEVLGLSSELNGLSNGDPEPTGPISPMDLFRYDSSGNRSFNTGVNTAAYFSIDSTNDIIQFNQEQGGDFQDWYSFFGGQTPHVQDAYSTAGATPVLGPELRALDAIGFTRVLPQFSITASAGTGGTISPTGTFNKDAGANVPFTASPDSSHFVSQWLVDSSAVQTNGTTYTLMNVQAAHTVQVTFLTKTNQTITFAALPARALGEAAFPLTAMASSGLPVSYSVFSGPASLSGTNLTVTGLGSVTIQASQTGNTYYSAASTVNQSFTVYTRPAATAGLSGTNLLLSWSTNVPGFSVLSATNLAPPVNWQSVALSPTVVNGKYVVTNPAPGKTVFYELKK